MARVIIIADDLTGALDSGAEFARLGLSVRVAHRLSQLPALLDSGADVVAISTGTREATAEVARRRLAPLRALVGTAPGVIFKKIDSRLKGPIATELDALLPRTAPAPIVCPAIPRLGRICRDGFVTGAGVSQPLPIAPAIGRPARILPAATEAEIDAALPADLRGAILVGAAGLAAALARRLSGGVPPPPTGLPPAASLPTPAVLAIGSRDPVTLEQIAALPVTLPATIRLLRPPAGEDAGAARDFPVAAAAAVRSGSAGTLFACGGETAAAILDALDAGLLTLTGEVLAGVPMAWFGLGPRRICLVTKSGGFGPPETLTRLIALIDPAAARA